MQFLFTASTRPCRVGHAHSHGPINKNYENRVSNSNREAVDFVEWVIMFVTSVLVLRLAT